MQLDWCHWLISSWVLELDSPFEDEDKAEGFEPQTLEVELSFETTHYLPHAQNRMRTTVNDSFKIVTIFTGPGDPAADIVMARKPQFVVDGDLAFTEIRRWISECKTHNACPLPVEKYLPTHVIDVVASGENRECRLVETNGTKGYYVALSYCWGPSQKGVTTDNNADARKKRLEVECLSRKVQDAVHVTRGLGFKYI